MAQEQARQEDARRLDNERRRDNERRLEDNRHERLRHAGLLDDKPSAQRSVRGVPPFDQYRQNSRELQPHPEPRRDGEGCQRSRNRSDGD